MGSAAVRQMIRDGLRREVVRQYAQERQPGPITDFYGDVAEIDRRTDNLLTSYEALIVEESWAARQ